VLFVNEIGRILEKNLVHFFAPYFRALFLSLLKFEYLSELEDEDKRNKKQTPKLPIEIDHGENEECQVGKNRRYRDSHCVRLVLQFLSPVADRSDYILKSQIRFYWSAIITKY
jgi:hypothetical protein